MTQKEENVSIFWDPPLNADGSIYEHLKEYELHHNIPGYPNPLVVPPSVTSGGPLPLPKGKYSVAVRAVNNEGHKSEKIITKFQVKNPPLDPTAKRFGRVCIGGVINSATSITGGTFSVDNTTSWSFAGGGAPQVFTTFYAGETDRFEQDCTDVASLDFSTFGNDEQAIKSHYILFDYSDADDPWKLIKYEDTVFSSSNNLNIPYFYDTGDGDVVAEDTFVTQTGTVTVAAESNEVVGNGTDFQTEYEIDDIIYFNSTKAGIVTYIDSDVSLNIDRTFTTAISGSSIKKQGLTIDPDYDSLVYTIRNNNNTFEKYSIFTNVDTEAGISGRSNALVSLYRASTDGSTAPTAFTGTVTYTFSSGAVATDGNLQSWTPTVPTVAAGSYLWVRQATASSTTTSDTIAIGEWSDAVVMSAPGADGVAGADGAEGAAGEDGVGIEYIFAITADSGTSPSAPNNSWGFDQPSSPWYDGAPSMTTSNKALWRAQRDIEGTPDVGDAVSDSWSGSTVVGRFGDDGDAGATGLQGVAGQDGDDGAGIEFIFAKTSDSGTSPSAPNNNWGFDSPQSPWSDAAPSLDTSNKALWRAQRAILGNPDVGDAVSDSWSDSTVVGRFADDGVEGADGADGAGIEYIFAVTSDSDTSPSAPSNSWGFDSPSSPWYDGAPSMTTSNKALWRAQRAILGNPSSGDSVSANWSGSTVVGRFADDGVDGAAGADGSAGTSARAVNLTMGDQTFEYNTSGLVPSPTSAVVTSTAMNTTGTPYYQFFKNDVSVQNTTTNTYTYTPPTNYSSMPEKIEVQIREGSSSGTIYARDQITASGLQAGSDAIVTVLSNEAHTLPVTVAGVVTYTNSGTDITAWLGTTQLNYGTGNSQFVISSVTGSGISIGSASTVSSNIRRYGVHNSMSADTATITYNIAVKDATGTTSTFTRVQSFAKSHQGDTGQDGTNGQDGTPGETGATGPDGEPLRNAQVYFFHNHYQATAPTAPSLYTVAYDFGESEASTTAAGWDTDYDPPDLPASGDTRANKLHAVKVVFQETEYDGAYTETMSAVFPWTSFDGLVTFTNLSLAMNEEGTQSATIIDGGAIKTGTIEVDTIKAGSNASLATGREFHLGVGAAIGSESVVMWTQGTADEMSGIAGIGGTGGIGVGGASRGTASAGGWFGNALTDNYATTGWNTYCEMAIPARSAVFGGTVDIKSRDEDGTEPCNLNIGTATNTGSNCINIAEGVAGGQITDQISIFADRVTSTGNSTLALVLKQDVEAIGTYTASHKIKIKINAVEYWLSLDAV